MLSQKIYLTIDDAPSRNTAKVVADLVANNMPAVFYARGEFIDRYADQLVVAIKNDFLVGNHSFSHPYFSQLPVAACIKEIEQAERVIENTYRIANKPRPRKVIRMPWSDRGAGPDCAVATDEGAHEKCARIQEYLRQEGFSSLNFLGFDDEAIDAPCSFKTGDFKEKYLSDHQSFLRNLDTYFKQSRREYEVVMAHDFDRNYELMRLTIEFFAANHAVMLAPNL